jgi:uncharacterized protein YjbI with pentapeptide repeats
VLLGEKGMGSIKQRFSETFKNPKFQNILIAVGAATNILLWSYFLYDYLIIQGNPWPLWTGFGGFIAPDGTYYAAKTLWDVLDLLIVPLVLAIGAILFNRSEKANEQKITDDRQNEQALQNYLDKMAELMLKEKLLEKKDALENPIVDVAHIRTITALRILDKGRKGILLQFLQDSGLSDFVLQKATFLSADLSYLRLSAFNLSRSLLSFANFEGAHLNNIDMREAIVSGANLSGANLSEANLSGAIFDESNLTNTFLSGANLRGASLRKANLQGAELRGAEFPSLIGAQLTVRQRVFKISGDNSSAANLSGADLSGDNLSGAKLNGVDLSGADLSGANLKGTFLAQANLSGANLSGASLKGTYLAQANLSGAKVTDEQLSLALSYEGATMPDGAEVGEASKVMG